MKNLTKRPLLFGAALLAFGPLGQAFDERPIEDKLCDSQWWSQATTYEISEMTQDHVDNLVCANANGNRMLHMAAANNNDLQVFDALIDMNANPHQENDLGQIPSALLPPSGNPEILNLLSNADGEKTAHSVAAGRSAGEWYIGIEGAHTFNNTIETESHTNDIPTNCDQFLPNPPHALGSPECQPGLTGWQNESDLEAALNALPNIQVGRSFGDGNWRAEVEFFNRSHSGPDSPTLPQETGSGGKTAEFVSATEIFGNVQSYHLFGNAYRDMPVTDKLSFSLGTGLGISQNKMDYYSRFTRNYDPDVLADLGRNPHAAGTTSSANHTLEDTNINYQVMAGVDYRLTDNVALFLKLRYVGYFDDFEDGNEWDQLRSHESAMAPGGDRVHYTQNVGASDMGYLAAGAGFKFYFNGPKGKNKQRR